MSINPETKLMGLIGSKIDYSLSPTIHNFSAKRLGINAVYLCLPVEERAIETTLQALWDLGCIGLNVTKPYKMTVGHILNPANPVSVNTLRRGSDWWIGSSTDGPGFASALRRAGLEIGGFKKIVILGNGGAATAIVDHVRLAFDQHPELVVARRSAGHDGAFLARVGGAQVRFCGLSVGDLQKELAYAAGEVLCIQATSAPLHGDSMSKLIPAFDKFSGVFVDLVYGQPSAIFDSVKQRGLLCQDGLPMLIEQARLSQRAWWGQACDFDAIESALKKDRAAENS